jgi:hypothetical protein
MRKFLLAAIAVGTLASIGMTASPTQARDHPLKKATRRLPRETCVRPGVRFSMSASKH